MEISPFYRLKILIAGLNNVGKSSLTHLVRHDEYLPRIEPTIGMGFTSTEFELEEYPLSNPSKLPNYYTVAKQEFGIAVEKNNQLVKVQVWDCSGSRRFEKVQDVYMRDIDICFLVFDLTNRESWDEIPKWRERVSSFSKHESLPIFVLVGTKSDLKNHVVTVEEMKERSEFWGIKYYILSAVQDSSPSMLRRMLYMTVQNYHDMLLTLSYENKPIPPHVTTAKISRKSSFIDLTVDGEKSYCCSIS
jgi:small GTP-binding protein